MGGDASYQVAPGEVKPSPFLPIPAGGCQPLGQTKVDAGPREAKPGPCAVSACTRSNSPSRDQRVSRSRSRRSGPPSGHAGQRGAESLAVALTPYCPSIRVIAPPDGIKDVRDWKRAGAGHEDIMVAIDAVPARRLVVCSRRVGGGLVHHA